MKKRSKVAILACLVLAAATLFTSCASILGAMMLQMSLEGTWTASDSSYNYEYNFVIGNDGNTYTWKKTSKSTGSTVGSDNGTWRVDYDTDNDMALMLVIGSETYKDYKLDSFNDTLQLTTGGIVYHKQK